MRIFTLGRNGIPLFLFALILFSGTLSSYGQCPTVTDQDPDVDGVQQYFCDSESMLVQDLEATGTEVVWYLEEDLENPLPTDTMLISGKVYYAEDLGATEACTSLPSVTVTLYKAPEILGIYQTRAKGPSTKQSLPGLVFCVEDIENPGITLEEIRTDADENGVQWFSSRTSTTQLAANTVLTNGTVYWVQQTSPSGCTSTRRSVSVTLVSEAAPTGEADQSFCITESPTLGDIVASGINRYYTTATGAVELNENTPLQVGSATYYLSSVGPTCESIDRLAVTVTVNPVNITSTEQAFCRNQSEGNELGLAAVSHLSPAGGTWYADKEFTQILTPETLLEDDATYYLAPENCASTSVHVTLYDTPNAGQTSTAYFCENAGPNTDLYDQIINPEHMAEAGRVVDRGTVDNAAFNGLLFDPAVLGVGTHVLTHTVEVEEGSLCENDSAEITVIVYEAPDAGEDVTDTFCASELDSENILLDKFTSYLAERDQTGTFDLAETADVVESYTLSELPDALNVDPAAPAGTYEVNYIVTASNVGAECSDVAVISMTIQENLFAGNDATIQFLDGVENTESIAEALARVNPAPAPEPGGVWTNEAGETVDGTTVPTTPGVYTYTVTQEGFCSDIALVTVLCPEAGEDVLVNQCFTAEDTLPTEAEFLALFTDGSRDPNNFSTPLEELRAAYAINPFGTFETEYTVSASDPACTNTATFSVTFTENLLANAGDPVTPTVCTTAGVQNLFDFLTEDAVPGGTFSAPYENGTFDPSAVEGTSVEITYTISEELGACVTGEASATINITIVEGPVAGENGAITLASTDAPVNLFDSLGGTPDGGGYWNTADGTGNIDPANFVPGVYDYTYTVTNENGCEVMAVVTVTITGELTCPQVTSPQAFCETIGEGNFAHRPTVSDLLPIGATWYAAADATQALPGDTLLENAGIYFAGNPDGPCDPSQSVTVTVDEAPNAGSTASATFCENQGQVDLLFYMNESALGPADLGGTFTPALANGGTTFDPAVDAPGRYTYRVESQNNACPADEAVIDITIIPNAYAGEDLVLTFCASKGPQNLFEYLGEGISTEGTFSGFEDGIFDPAVDVPGVYTYTVQPTGNCQGVSTANITINLGQATPAPAAVAQSFCASEGATVGTLQAGAEGDALLWYIDAELQTLADEEDVLVTGTYYVTNNPEGACESPATVVEVTVTDAPTPTLVQGGNIFCQFDDPTIAELSENVEVAGTLIWYDAATGGNVVSSSELLVDGVTYYAASTVASSACESAVRLAVTVDLGNCPVFIPDAFSPNGDAINDTFVIPHIEEQFPNYSIEIFNRWGNIVFKGNASTPSWDGISTESRSIGDGVLPVGVYFYIVNFNDGQTAPVQGRLYLSR